MPGIPSPESTAITPDGRYAVVSNGGGETDAVSVDLQTGTVVNTVAGLPSNEAVAVTPDGTQALVLSNGLGEVAVLSISSSGVLADTGQRVSIAPGGLTIAITPDGQFALVPVGQNLYVLQSNSGTWSLLTTLTGLGTVSFGVAISPDGSKAYLGGSSQIVVINIAGSVVSDSGIRITPPAGTQGTALFGIPGLAVTPDGTRLFVLSHANDVLSVIDTTTNAVILTIPVADAPIGIGMPPRQ